MKYDQFSQLSGLMETKRGVDLNFFGDNSNYFEVEYTLNFITPCLKYMTKSSLKIR